MNRAINTCIILISIILTGFGQEIPVPENFSIVDTVTGDLDKDSIKELVVAYNTDVGNALAGVERELIIYKPEDNKWIVWKTSRQALYASRDGGMMGDPFGEIIIENGILIINHNGGSSWKWSITDKYRFQNDDFYLIGYTSNYGKPCEYWEDVDFNLSTGKMIVKKEFETCDDKKQEISKSENETLFEKGLKITLQFRQEKDIIIITPLFGHEIYIANGKQ